MSGHKRATITIQEEDLNRLRQAEERLRTVEKDYRDLHDKIKAHRVDNLWQSLDQFAQRQNNFHEMIAEIGEDLQTVEIQTTQNLLGQFEQVSSQIQSFGIELWNQTENLLAEQEQAIQQIQHDQLASQQAQFTAIQQVIRRMENSEEERYQAVMQTFEAADTFFHGLLENYDVEFYQPGALETYQQLLQQAETNIHNGFLDAGLVFAQQAYHGLSSTRLYIEKSLFETELLRQAALSEAYRLFEIARQNRTVQAIDLEGNVLTIQLHVDFWTHGKMSQINQELRQIIGILRDGELEKAEFQTYLHRFLPELEAGINDAVFSARWQAIASQIRFNLAECIVDALQDQGFQLQNGNYQLEDMRSPYEAIVKSIDGSEVKIMISPSLEGWDTASIDLIAFDQEQRTEAELRQRSKELANALAQRGLSIGQFTTQPTSTQKTHESVLASPLNRPNVSEVSPPYFTQSKQRHRGAITQRTVLSKTGR